MSPFCLDRYIYIWNMLAGRRVIPVVSQCIIAMVSLMSWWADPTLGYRRKFWWWWSSRCSMAKWLIISTWWVGSWLLDLFFNLTNLRMSYIHIGYIWTNIYVQVLYTYVCLYVYIYIHNMCQYTNTLIYTCTCMHTCMHIYISIHRYLYIYICTCIHCT